MAEQKDIWQSRKRAFLLSRQKSIKEAKLLEKNLDSLFLSTFSFEDKCLQILDVCKNLQSIYNQAGDKKNNERINNLLKKIAKLAIRDLEIRSDAETDREKRLIFIGKIMSIEDTYLDKDSSREKCLLRQMNNLLQTGETLEINGKLYNKTFIRDYLSKNAMN